MWCEKGEFVAFVIGYGMTVCMVNTPKIFESSSLHDVSNNVTNVTSFDGSLFCFSNVDTGEGNVFTPDTTEGPNVTVLKEVVFVDDTPIIQSAFINTKLISYAGAVSALSFEPLKCKANFCHLEIDNVCEGIDLSIPSKVVQADGISLIATKIGNPVMLDSFTSLMCINSWRRSSFARCLIEVKADEVLKDSITMGIPLPIGLGFNKETPVKPKGIFEPKAYGNSLKNEVTNVSTSAKDGSNIVHTSSKEQPAKAVDIPSSSYTSDTAKKGGLKDPTSSSNIPTSNPYDLLSQKFGPKNYTRSRGDPNSVHDDMESGEEVEVVFDETTNFFSSTITRASTYTAPDISKT
ncbi:hypothetical protein Tco_0473902 [Tanacetum coccineum]